MAFWLDYSYISHSVKYAVSESRADKIRTASPSDAHHLKFAQGRALARKVSVFTRNRGTPENPSPDWPIAETAERAQVSQTRACEGARRTSARICGHVRSAACVNSATG